MKRNLFYSFTFLIASSLVALGQSDKVKFGAIGRGFIQESRLAGDTSNPYLENTGEAMVDLRLNINPNKKTELGAVIRMQSSLGGFYGAGSTLSLRQLYLKGSLYNVVNYEVGDIYLELSPYTLFNNHAEGGINEANVFLQLRNDLVYYDNFNIGNAWWSQGGHVDFALNLDEEKEKKLFLDLFTSRIRSNATMRFLSGGKADLQLHDNFNLTCNGVRIFDAKAVNPLSENLNNTVFTLEGHYKKSLHKYFLLLDGESGQSNYQIIAPLESADSYIVPSDKKGGFFTLRAGIQTKDERFSVGGKYFYNSTYFFSAASQTKRIDFNANPTTFINVANDPFNARSLHAYDLISSTAIYNPIISSTLMTYDPKFENAMPYGDASPNRKGVIADAAFRDSLKLIEVKTSIGLLSDVSGEGTIEKRNFIHAVAECSTDLRKLLDLKKDMKFYGGLLFNQTTRDGKVSAIDLSSLQVDAGFDAELFNHLYANLGYKIISAKGNEFIFDRSNNNDYPIPSFYTVDGTDQLFATGLRYQFTDNIYLSLNNLSVAQDDRDGNTAYNFNQWLLFFSLKM